MFGSTTSGAAAIYGTGSDFSAGLSGTSSNGDGVDGNSSGSGDGVFGSSTSGTGVSGYSESDSGTGVYGFNFGGGTGVYASTSSGAGLYGDALSGYGVQAHTSRGPEALTAFNDSGDGSDIRGTYIGMIGRAPASGGYPLVLTDSNGNDLFQVDGAGNVAFTGQLQTLARTSGGGTVQSYSPKATEPVMEDTGTAQLSAGSASVMLDPTFAASIDMRTPYRVFITPDGDTHGLFVALKTAHGFIVRESQGGRSSVAFDYRIVASTQGQIGKRMSLVSSAIFARAPITALKHYAAPALPSKFAKK